MAQMERAGKSDEGATGEGFLGEEGFVLNCYEKEGVSWAGRQHKRK